MMLKKIESKMIISQKVEKLNKMEFKITIILSHIENQSVEDMELNAQNYIKEFIEDDELYIESIENITINKRK